MLRRWNPIQRYCPVIKVWTYETQGKRQPCGNKLRPGHKYCRKHKTRWNRRYGTMPPPKTWMKKIRSNRCQKRGCWNKVIYGSIPYLPNMGQYCHRHHLQCISLGCPAKPEGRDVFCPYHRKKFRKRKRQNRCDYCYSRRHGYKYNLEACIQALQKNTGLSLEEISEETGIPLKNLPTKENTQEGDPLWNGRDYRRVWLVYVWQKMGMWDLLDFYNLI